MDEHRTEAACLLETGALYRRRIGLQPSGCAGELVFAGFKQGAFSLYFGDAPISHFDLEGRWQRAYLEGLHYLKGLDAEVHEIDRVREGRSLVLRRRKLSFGEAADLDERIRSVALELMTGLSGGQFRRREPPDGKAIPIANEELRDILDRISRWDTSAWFAHRERYTGTYGPLPFLPPECQNAVVLQATLGHAEGSTFALSAAAEPYVRTEREFAQHVRDIKALWGRRLLQSRVIFLAGDDVLRQPAVQVENYLDAIGTALPIGGRDVAEDLRFDGVHAFLDDFAGRRYTEEEWRRLSERGLVRISLGVESGDPDVRTAFNKEWNDDELRSTVAALKAAGLGTSVMTLVGAGGAERAGQHVERTARLIESLDLRAGDFVFLIDENEIREPGVLPAAGLSPLAHEEWTAEQARLKESLAPLKERRIKVLPYTLEKQWT
jgi:hypothetical protein